MDQQQLDGYVKADDFQIKGDDIIFAQSTLSIRGSSSLFT